MVYSQSKITHAKDDMLQAKTKSWKKCKSLNIGYRMFQFSQKCSSPHDYIKDVETENTENGHFVENILGLKKYGCKHKLPGFSIRF